MMRSKSFSIVIAVNYGIVFDVQFKNNCALTQFTYVLMQFSPKHERTSTISSYKHISVSVFEEQRLERTDFAVVHQPEQG